MWKSARREIVPPIFFPNSAENRIRNSPPPHPPGHYADEVSTRAQPPFIPAAALARKAQLQSVLRGMEARGPSREPACFQALRTLGDEPRPADLDGAFDSILSGHLAEEASELLRTLRREVGPRAWMESFASRLAPMAAMAHQERSVRWQMDTRRAHIRCCYEKDDGALGFDDGDLHAIFLHAFRLEGLHLLLDLGKRPRPLLTAGLPLPVGVAGRAEFLEAVLKQEPMERPAEVMAGLNHRLPLGLGIHQWEILPGYASPVSELALHSHWRWEAPLEVQPQAMEKTRCFLEASQWSWDRGNPHPGGPLDLRQVVSEMAWEHSTLCFTTRMREHPALNPLKLLGAILGIEAADIKGLIRTGVDLKPDPRLGQADLFQPKLKNMYEDAVLLDGGSNIVLVDEDDDEPIHLGPPAETT